MSFYDKNGQYLYDFNQEDQIIKFLRERVNKISDFFRNNQFSNNSLHSDQYKEFESWSYALELIYENIPDYLMMKLGQSMIGKFAKETEGKDFTIEGLLNKDLAGSYSSFQRNNTWGNTGEDIDNVENKDIKKINTKKAAPVVQEKAARMTKDTQKVFNAGGQKTLMSFFGAKKN